MKAVILTIGTEILMGELLDTNSVYLASELPKYGITLKKAISIGDVLEEIQNSLHQELHSSDIVITTGGMGPTSDDLTREAIAEYCEEKMAVDEEQLNTLKQLFQNRGQQMPSTNIKQAFLIPSASAIPNSKGTAPGWLVKKNGKIIVAMPGPPAELLNMWNNHVVPSLKSLVDGDVFFTRNIKSFGISEGELDEKFSHLFGLDNPFLGIYSKQDGIHLRLIAHSKDITGAQKLIDPIEKEIVQSIGDSIWGFDDDTPAHKLMNLLTEKRLQLNIWEGFTNGLIAHNLSEAAGNDQSGFQSYVPIESHGANVDKKNVFFENPGAFVTLESNYELEERNTLATIEVTYGDLSITHHARYKEVTTRVKQRVANQAILKTIELINISH